jgi:hypothetical protein
MLPAVYPEVEARVREEVMHQVDLIGSAAGLVAGVALSVGAGMGVSRLPGPFGRAVRVIAGVGATGVCLLADGNVRPALGALAANAAVGLVRSGAPHDGTANAPPLGGFAGDPPPSLRLTPTPPTDNLNNFGPFCAVDPGPFTGDHNLILFYLTVFGLFGALLLAILFLIEMLPNYPRKARTNRVNAPKVSETDIGGRREAIRALKVFLFFLIFAAVAVFKLSAYFPFQTEEDLSGMIEMAYRFSKTLGLYVLGREFSLLLERFFSAPSRFRNLEIAGGIRKFSDVFFDSFWGLVPKLISCFMLVVIFGFFLYFIF